MIRIRSLMVLAVTLVVGATMFAATATPAAEESQRGSGRGRARSSSLLGLLMREQVQKEMKLNQEQTTKVQEIIEKLGAELREQYSALREIEDRQKQRERMNELRDEFDRKVREQLADVVKREQMIRLYQIRLQVRAVVDSLANRYVVGKLKLTEDQKKKLAEINSNVQAKRSELFSSMRDASREQRSEAYQKYRKMRSDADEQALGVLTDEQKKTFEEMKGEKIELEMGRGPR